MLIFYSSLNFKYIYIVIGSFNDYMIRNLFNMTFSSCPRIILGQCMRVYDCASETWILIVVYKVWEIFPIPVEEGLKISLSISWGLFPRLQLRYSGFGYVCMYTAARRSHQVNTVPVTLDILIWYWMQYLFGNDH